MTHLKKHERRLSAGILIAAPLAGLVGGLLTVDHGGEISQELEYIASDNASWLIANYFTLLMGALMTVALVILVALVRDRAAVLGYLGGALAIVGMYFHGAVVGYSLVQAPLVESALPDDAVLNLAGQAMYEHAAFTTMLIPFLGFFAGMILLAAAVWRSRTAPVWIAALMAAAPLTEFVGPRAVSPELMYVLLVISFGYVAAQMLRRGQEAATAAAPLLEAQQADPAAPAAV